MELDVVLDPRWWARYPGVRLGAQCALAAVVGYVAWMVADQIARRLSQHSMLMAELVRHARPVARLLIPVLFVQVTLADAEVPTPKIEHWVSILIIVLITAFVIRLVQAVASVVEMRNPVDAADNLHARRVQTQTRVLSRTAMSLIGLLGAASVLMTFPGVRQIGASLLASAGLAGIVAGLAARPVLGNLIAGMQIALAQPIRIDDVVIVENEWGRVEEINSSFVVVRIWDDRRLVVPLEYFIQKPFQNWTRRSSELLGTVFLWVDFRMPLAPLREKLHAICESAREWDRRVCVLHVVEVSETAMQLRALVSSADAGSNWDLRARVREELIAFLQEHYPHFLPQTRAQLLDGRTQSAKEREKSAPSTGPTTRREAITP